MYDDTDSFASDDYDADDYSETETAERFAYEAGLDLSAASDDNSD